jgi:hypothetical protein
VPAFQKRGVGTLLFETIEAAVLVLAESDMFVRLNFGGEPNFFVQSCVDKSVVWQQRWLLGMGFELGRQNSEEATFWKVLKNPAYVAAASEDAMLP